MGGMKYDNIKQCGKRCKELGPLTSVSLPPAATYEEVIEKAKEEFFTIAAQEGRYEYFLADPQGNRLSKNINGNRWNLAEYIHLHGYYPSKTKIYCVQQCDKEKPEIEESVIKANQTPALPAAVIQIPGDRNQIETWHPTSPQPSQVLNHQPSEVSNPRPNQIPNQPGRHENVENDKEGKHGNNIGACLIPASSIHLGNQLGEGGFGTVYVSDFNGTLVAGTLVAVTQLKMDKSADVDHMNEIKALSVLCHPNIVLFMGYTHQDNCIPIITNFVEGCFIYYLRRRNGLIFLIKHPSQSKLHRL
ncbi:RAF proto-oncogene serine/threonine-protein kinase-like isoform X3 [Dysidea avara]